MAGQAPEDLRFFREAQQGQTLEQALATNACAAPEKASPARPGYEFGTCRFFDLRAARLSLETVEDLHAFWAVARLTSPTLAANFCIRYANGFANSRSPLPRSAIEGGREVCKISCGSKT